MAFDTYLWIDGIPGEATRQGYEKWIEVESFSWGANNRANVASGTGGMGAGRADVTSFFVTKLTDASSPILFESCCTGKHLKSLKVVLNKAGEKSLKFLTYDFKDVFIDSVQWGGASVGDKTQPVYQKADWLPPMRANELPSELLSFAFGSVEISYTPQTATGAAGSPIRGSYDVQKGTK